MEPENNEFDIDAGVATIAEGLGITAEPEPELETPVPEGADPVVEATPADPNAAAPVETAPVARAVPQSWSKDKHEVWAKLPPDAQEQILHREKQMLDGLEQYKGDAGLGRTMREITTPYKALLASQGVDEGKAVSVLLNAHYKLSTLPAESRAQYFAQLAQTYGIDLAGLPAQQATQESPEVRAMRERVEKLEGSLTQREQAAYTQAKQKTSAEVNAFAAANPYFDEVADDIDVRSRDTRRAPTEPLGKMDDTMKETLAEIIASPLNP
jgi:hypothetical protein